MDTTTYLCASACIESSFRMALQYDINEHDEEWLDKSQEPPRKVISLPLEPVREASGGGRSVAVISLSGTVRAAHAWRTFSRSDRRQRLKR